jgi:hypothetical protein
MTPLRRFSFLLLALFSAVPIFAAISSDVTLPATGYLELPTLTYRTEVVLTNHRDVRQYVQMILVNEGHQFRFRVFSIEPKQTHFMADGGFGSGGGRTNFVGALRIQAILTPPGGSTGDGPYGHDPLGQIEARAFVVADRGRFASKGSTRQEIEGIPSSEYTAEESVFLAVRHDLGTGVYTNVGIVNMHPTQTETFYVEFQYGSPATVVVPPNSVRQIRVPGEGNAGRYVRVYPEWSTTDELPARTTPWVSYASTVDIQTGDAFSGIRVPPSTTYNRLD